MNSNSVNEVKASHENEWFEIVLSVVSDTKIASSYHSGGFKTFDEAVAVWQTEYRDRKKGDGHDEYWNNIPMMIQKVTKKVEIYW